MKKVKGLLQLIKFSHLNYSHYSTGFVPAHKPVLNEDVYKLQNFINKSTRLFVITGAGISTESGIPDYRSEGVGLYSRTNHRPMKIQEFLSSKEARQRYWARNFIGWPSFSSSTPNISHYILNDWKKSGKISTLVTQNVDGLHIKAGTLDTIELHGSGYRVNCLSCHHQMHRDEFQKVLIQANPHFTPENRDSEIRPDGDIYLNEDEVRKFVLPDCPECNVGILQPDIVFFGANVKKTKVDYIYDQLDEADSVLVLGSTLQVFSSLRFVLRAKEKKLPIGIISLGVTRGDELSCFKIMAKLSDILSYIKIN